MSSLDPEYGPRALNHNTLLCRRRHALTPNPGVLQNLFNDEVFAKMKKGCRIVNVARGGVIDDAALARALDAGIVAQVGNLESTLYRLRLWMGNPDGLGSPKGYSSERGRKPSGVPNAGDC